VPPGNGDEAGRTGCFVIDPCAGPHLAQAGMGGDGGHDLGRFVREPQAFRQDVLRFEAIHGWRCPWPDCSSPDSLRHLPMLAQRPNRGAGGQRARTPQMESR